MKKHILDSPLLVGEGLGSKILSRKSCNPCMFTKTILNKLVNPKKTNYFKPILTQSNVKH